MLEISQDLVVILAILFIMAAFGILLVIRVLWNAPANYDDACAECRDDTKHMLDSVEVQRIRQDEIDYVRDNPM